MRDGFKSGASILTERNSMREADPLLISADTAKRLFTSGNQAKRVVESGLLQRQHLARTQESGLLLPSCKKVTSLIVFHCQPAPSGKLKCCKDSGLISML